MFIRIQIKNRDSLIVFVEDVSYNFQLDFLPFILPNMYNSRIVDFVWGLLTYCCLNAKFLFCFILLET